MDLRVKKTKNSIVGAFLELRAQKPLEKITVKELAEKAMINKATFYLHYKDIYDLSDSLEAEVMQSVLNSCAHPESVFQDTQKFTKELTDAYFAHGDLIHILFSGNQMNKLPQQIEQSIKQMIFEKYPELKDDIDYNIYLSYSIYGGYYAFVQNDTRNHDRVTELIGKFSDEVRTIIEKK